MSALQKCKFCGEPVNLDDEGNTYADGTAAHEACHDSSEFEQANAIDSDREYGMCVTCAKSFSDCSCKVSRNYFRV